MICRGPIKTSVEEGIVNALAYAAREGLVIKGIRLASDDFELLLKQNPKIFNLREDIAYLNTPYGEVEVVSD